MKKIFALVSLIVVAFARGESGIAMPNGWKPIEGAQFNMSLYARVMDFDGGFVESPGSALAVFDADGVCRGVARIEDGPSGKWFQMTVVSNAASEKGLLLKALDAAAGEIRPISEGIEFIADATLPAEDYTTNPLVLHVRPLTAELSISLVQNWNWISFNVQQGERTILEFLADYTPHATDGDIIKTQNGQATYSGGKWYASPTNFRLEPGRMYKLRKQAAGSCTITVNGVPCTGNEEIPVVAGWNWIGYTGDRAASIGAIFKDVGFANNDLMKPQSGAQATFSGDRWYGALVLRPGLGYMLRQAASGSVDYRNLEGNEVE